KEARPYKKIVIIKSTTREKSLLCKERIVTLFIYYLQKVLLMLGVVGVAVSEPQGGPANTYLPPEQTGYEYNRPSVPFPTSPGPQPGPGRPAPPSPPRPGPGPYPGGGPKFHEKPKIVKLSQNCKEHELITAPIYIASRTELDYPEGRGQQLN
ncbi:hypothetical protein L9F63_014069, partial [Diploptera punctata]